MGDKSEIKKGLIPKEHVLRVLESVGCFVEDMPEDSPGCEIWHDKLNKLTASLKRAPDSEVSDIFGEAVALLGKLAANSVLACGWLSMAVNPDHKTVYVRGRKGRETHEKETRVCIQ